MRIVGLILDELTGVGLLRLQILVYCKCLSLWNLIYPLLLYIDTPLMFQTCKIHKEVHHTSSTEIFMGGLRVLIV